MNQPSKTYSKIFVGLLFVIVPAVVVNAQTVLAVNEADIVWGSEIDQPMISLFSDQNGNYFSNGEAVVAIGGFTELPTFEPNPSTFNNFVVVAESASLFNSSQAGFFQGAASELDSSAWSPVIGEVAYIAVAKGASTFNDVSMASEFGLWTSDLWSSLPAGSNPTPEDYFAQLPVTGSDFSSLIGSFDPDGGVGNGNLYKTEAIPEPSAYATILGLLGLGYAVFCRRRRSSFRE